MKVRIFLPLLLVAAACQMGDAALPVPVASAAVEPTHAPTTTLPAPATTLPTATTTLPTPTTTLPTATTTLPTPTSTTLPATTTTTTSLPEGVTEPPGWLGTHPLPEGEDGEPTTAPTPPELVDRRLVTVDHLPPPPDASYHSSVGPVPDAVASRSTWSEECPVALEELAYVTVTFLGFDQQPHTGELLVSESVADDIVTAFHHLYEADYPIEEMRISSPEDLEAEPTGDGNNTGAFVCRPVTGGTGWSEHAYGLALDLNPFHNPYVRGNRVLPELAGSYVDRDRALPGTIHEGGAVTQAFDAIGWEWGGRWSSLKDYQHFSLRGR